MLLLSLRFVQGPQKLSNSLKNNRIRINCHEMGSHNSCQSYKCSPPMQSNERQHRTWKLQAQGESNSRPLPLQTQ